MTPIVNVDLDGVVYPFAEEMARWLDPAEGKTWPLPEHWEIHRSWPVTEAEFVEEMYAAIAARRVFRRGRPIEDSVWGLDTLRDIGFHVRLVTSKAFPDPFITYAARTSTLMWLHEKGVPHDTIAFTDGLGKTTYAADVVVDDKPAVGEWAQRDALNLLFGQPWNRYNPGTSWAWDGIPVRRVLDWRHVVQAAEERLDAMRRLEATTVL